MPDRIEKLKRLKRRKRDINKQKHNGNSGKKWSGKHKPEYLRNKKKEETPEDIRARNHANKLRGMDKKKYDSKSFIQKKIHSKKW